MTSDPNNLAGNAPGLTGDPNHASVGGKTLFWKPCPPPTQSAGLPPPAANGGGVQIGLSGGYIGGNPVLVLGGNIGGGWSRNSYSDFPTFDGSGWGAGGFAVLRYYFQPNLFVGPEFGGMFLNVNGTNPDGAFSKYRWMTYEGGQVGYTFAVPNTTRANLYLGAAFSQGGINVGVNAGDFSESMSKTLNGWPAHGGIEFQPAPVSIPNLWFGVDYRYSRWSGNVDGDPVSAGIHMISGTASFQIPVGR